MNVVQERQELVNKIKYYNGAANEIYSYINTVDNLISLTYELEPDNSQRRAKVAFLQKSKRVKEIDDITALYKIIHHQGLMVDLYEKHFIFGKYYYFM